MTLKYGYLFNIDRKILIFQAWWYENKIVFRVNQKSTLFQSWNLSTNQRWQIDLESTWILHWPTSRRYFNIYQRWINIECLLGIYAPAPLIVEVSFTSFYASLQSQRTDFNNVVLNLILLLVLYLPSALPFISNNFFFSLLFQLAYLYIFQYFYGFWNNLATFPLMLTTDLLTH